MKFGVRKPSLKRSIKARTTGKIKRQVKSVVNPLYGKKGMGYINDPKKAVYIRQSFPSASHSPGDHIHRAAQVFSIFSDAKMQCQRHFRILGNHSKYPANPHPENSSRPAKANRSGHTNQISGTNSCSQSCTKCLERRNLI